MRLTDAVLQNIQAELGSIVSDLFGVSPLLKDLMNRVLNTQYPDSVLSALVARVVDIDERRTMVLLKFALSTAEQATSANLPHTWINFVSS
jgi:hypothetical protein